MAAPSLANSDQEFNPESERIMEVVLEEGDVLDQAFVIYPTRGDWFLPLAQLADGLGLGIFVSPSLSGAEGFVIDENRKFQLDIPDCSVLHDGKKERFKCSDAMVFQEEIYVKAAQLQRWLPINITVSSLRSQVIIKARELLPAQSRRDRNRSAAKALEQGKEFDPGYPRVSLPYSVFEVPMVDEQLLIGPTFPANGTALLSNSTQLAGEVLGMEANAAITNSEKSVDSWRLTLSRRSADANLMGPLGLRRVSLFNVDLPTVPLVSSSTQGRGFLLSSYPLDTPTNFQNTDLTGPLPPGWEVFLYRNEVLIDRKTGDASGRYFFTNVGLLYGRNVFRLSFFGTHGERRQEYKTFTIDSSLMRRGEHAYRLGLLSLENLHQAFDFQFSQPVFSTLTASAGVSGEPTTNQYLTASLVGVTPYFLYSVRSAFCSDGGKGIEVGTQAGIGTAYLGAKYTKLYSFQSKLFPSNGGDFVSSQIEGSWFYVLPLPAAVAWSVEALNRRFVIANEQSTYTNRFSASLGSLQLQQEVSYLPGTTQPLNGRLEANYLPFAVRLRLAAEFTPSRLTAVESEAQYATGEFSMSATLRRQLDIDSNIYSLRVSHLFVEFALGAFASSQNGTNYHVGMQLSFSFSRDPRQGDWHMQRLPETAFGSASVFAFVDENDDGVPGPKEKGIPLVTLLVSGHAEIKSDATGVAYVTGLRPYYPADVGVTAEGDIDPLLRPKLKGVRFVPRAGKTARINFPFHYVGQIDGTVTAKVDGLESGRGRVPMVVADLSGKVLARTKSERDGFYSFDEVPAGADCVVLPDPKYLEKWNLTATPGNILISVPKKGEFKSGVSFTLTRR